MRREPRYPRQLKFEGDEYAIPIPTEPETLSPLQIDHDICQQSYTVTVPEHTRELSRIVSLSPPGR